MFVRDIHNRYTTVLRVSKPHVLRPEAPVKVTQLLRLFDRTYNKLRWWQFENERKGKQTGYVQTVGGRRINYRDPANCYTNSRNYPTKSMGDPFDLSLILDRTQSRTLFLRQTGLLYV